MILFIIPLIVIIFAVSNYIIYSYVEKLESDTKVIYKDIKLMFYAFLFVSWISTTFIVYSVLSIYIGL